MNADNLDIRLLRFRSRRDEYPLALATALLEAGRIPEALEVVQVGLVQSENDGALLVLEGRAWFEQGDLPQAQAALLRAAKASPRDKEPYRWLAQVLMKRGEPSRAVQVLERALQLDPTDRALQQAHMRAQRLSRIAHEADSQPPGPVESAPVAPPRSDKTARGSAEPQLAQPPLPKPVLPQPPKAPPVPAPRPGALAAPAARAAEGRRTVHDAETVPARVREVRPSPFDPVPDTAPPLELSRPLPPRNQGSDEDEPTVAAELPKELRSWLDAERSSHTPVPTAPRTSNDNAGGPAWRAAVDEDASFEDDAEPTVAVGSSALRGALDDADRAAPAYAEPIERGAPDSVSVQLDEPSAGFLASDPAEVAPPAEPEPPEQVLELLSQQGVFERSGRPLQDQTWVPHGDAPRSGNRIGRSFAVGWLLALCAAGGGYYGFTRYLEHRRGDAQSLIAQAERELADGQYESLLSAERHLSEARKLDPKSAAAVETLLFVHATRAIEEASGEMGYLRNSLARAKEKQVSPALRSAVEALLAAYEGNAALARSHAERALELGREEARILYLVGRLYQRAGSAEATRLLELASDHDPTLALAWLSRGELALLAGDSARAKELFGKALGEDGQELRAELWTIVVDSDAARAAELTKKLDGLSARIERGSASDKLLAISARAGLLLAAGDQEGARRAIREGAKLHGVRAPELTALFAERALQLGELELAYRAASSTLRAAPSVQRYRDTLISVLLKRGDGHAALSALQGMEGEGGSLLVARARAALLVGTREALEEAKRALSAHRASPSGKDDIDVGALLLRVDLRLGASGESLLPTARALAQRADQHSTAHVALAEVALSAKQGSVALAALEKARSLAPDDADVFFLQGRALRMTGKAQEAQHSLTRALQLAPSHVDARFALASLLLDRGDNEVALELYSSLERDDAGLSASLGASEALLAQGQLSSVEKRLERLEGADKDAPGALLLKARLWLAKGKGSEAGKVLEPLVREDSETRSAEVLALYGDALYHAERVDSAAGAYDAALELDSGHPDALVGRAMAALRAEKTSQAKELASKAASSLSTRVRPPRVQATLLLLQAKVDILESEFTRAKDKLSKAVALPGVPAEAHFWYGEALARTKTAGASEHYAKYLELAPGGYYAGRAKKALAPR